MGFFLCFLGGYKQRAKCAILPSTFLRFHLFILHSAGDPKIQAVVARSQQPRRRGQRSTESPGVTEEQRTRGRIAGMFGCIPYSPTGSPQPFNPSAVLHSNPDAAS